MPTKVISSIIVPRLQDNDLIIQPKDVVGEMQTDHGIQILYNKAWRAKEYVKNLVYGDPLHSFYLLASYCYMIEHKNLRTMTNLHIDYENRFYIYSWNLVLVFLVLSHVVDL